MSFKINKSTKVVSFILFCVGFTVNAQTYYVSPTGSTSNPGTQLTKPTTLNYAVDNFPAGSTIYLLGGTYTLVERITPKMSGSSSLITKIWAYPGEKPVIDGINMPKTSSGQAVRIKGSYYHLKGIEVKNAYDRGIMIEGSHNIIENCVSHHNGGAGIGITLAHCDATNSLGEIAAYNTIINCDSYLNFDYYTSGNAAPGGNADGFGCALNAGKGNKFTGCRSWSNSDDGWDLFESGFAVVIENCRAWDNGNWINFTDVYKQKTGLTLTESIFSGDGNGFKLGGNYASDCINPSKGTHELRNSVSFNNSNKGIDQNAHKDGVIVENCVSFNNYINIKFWQAANAGKTFVFNNNILFGTGTSGSGFTTAIVSTNNSWDKGQPVYTANDFVTVSPDDAIAPRQADGSLPANNFGKLKSVVGGTTLLKEQNSACYFSNNIFHIIQPNDWTISLYNYSGVLVDQFKTDNSISTIDFTTKEKGAYIVRLTSESENIVTKILKK